MLKSLKKKINPVAKSSAPKIPIKNNSQISKAIKFSDEDSEYWDDEHPPAVQKTILAGEDVNIKKVIENRAKYFSERVGVTLCPQLSSYGRAAYIQANVTLMDSEAGFTAWENLEPVKQTAWVLVAMSAIGAFTSSPVKALSLCPKVDKKKILIFYDGDWRPAIYSPGTGKKPVWHMRDGYSIPALGKEVDGLVYMDLPNSPTTPSLMAETALHQGKFRNPVDHVEDTGTISSRAKPVRPSNIREEIRSPSPLRGRPIRDLPPENDQYYPEPKSAKGKAVKKPIKSLKESLEEMRQRETKRHVVSSNTTKLR